MSDSLLLKYEVDYIRKTIDTPKYIPDYRIHESGTVRGAHLSREKASGFLIHPDFSIDEFAFYWKHEHYSS